MCVVSMVIQHGQDTWPNRHPWVSPQAYPPATWPTTFPTANPTIKELEDLRRDLQDMKELLKKALVYDKANNQEHCEDPGKVQFLQEYANAAGIDFSSMLKKL